MKNIILFIKGAFLGVVNLIPGVSGGTIAITLGIYDKLISVISHIFSNIKENIKFLLPIGLGMVLSILCFASLLSFCLNNYVLPTVLFFIGAILGGVPMLSKKIKNKPIKISNIITFLITFSMIIGLTFLSSSNNISLDSLNLIKVILLFIVGVIASATMIIPGVSGAAVLMTLGYYEPIVSTLKDLPNFTLLGHNLLVLVPFGLGVIAGILLIARLIEYLLKKHELKTYYAIFGFIFASVISILIQNIFMNSNYSFNVLELIIGIVLTIIGFIIAYKLGDK